MDNRRDNRWSRREFLKGVALAGSGALLRLPSDALAAEPPLETAKVKLLKNPAICSAPLYVAEELLRSEGFTDVQYVQGTGGLEDEKLLGTGLVISRAASSDAILRAWMRAIRS
jgi:NitT/TauT family transport system substrate-binding protein